MRCGAPALVAALALPVAAQSGAPRAQHQVVSAVNGCGDPSTAQVSDFIADDQCHPYQSMHYRISCQQSVLQYRLYARFGRFRDFALAPEAEACADAPGQESSLQLAQCVAAEGGWAQWSCDRPAARGPAVARRLFWPIPGAASAAPVPAHSSPPVPSVEPLVVQAAPSAGSCSSQAAVAGVAGVTGFALGALCSAVLCLAAALLRRGDSLPGPSPTAQGRECSSSPESPGAAAGRRSGVQEP
eukprot:TRINITY_DN12090_c0_g2_i1.p2 TRINITY_DN12090_c0_g2~~TRINITY_DN12090_c0_g2_i1.p2  ORF type:complete len:270 (+),score=77.51 TRINITY_DN12090_c0_g2_i1:82-810(+)